MKKIKVKPHFIEVPSSIPPCKMSVSGEHKFVKHVLGFSGVRKEWIFDIPKCEYCGMVDDREVKPTS